MIKLYQFHPAWGLPNASPFCMKIETYMRMADLPYVCERGADLRKSPKGKMPYIDDNGWLKPPLRWIVPGIARRGLWKEFHGHGMGRHTRDEIYAIGRRDITALADFLGGKTFFMGDRISSVDATAYAFLANVIEAPLESDFKRHAGRYSNLLAYCERMKSRYYG